MKAFLSWGIKMSTALIPGSFDPVTNGHFDIIETAQALFDNVFVCVLNNSAKNSVFSIHERTDMLRRTCSSFKNVFVREFSGSLCQLAEQINADVIIKGVRNASDFDYEFQMAAINESTSGVKTFFMPASAWNMFISSAMVRELASLGENIDDYVPECVRYDIEKKFRDLV